MGHNADMAIDTDAGEGSKNSMCMEISKEFNCNALST